MAYNPRDVRRYNGVTFETGTNPNNHSIYMITEVGKILGRTSIDLSKIDLIAGIKPGNIADLIRYGGNLTIMDSKIEIDRILEENGEAPQKGLNLVITLEEGDVKKTERWGMITSPILDIKPTKDY